VLLLAIISYLTVWIAVYTSWFNYFSYFNFGWWLATAFVMAAAIIFPFRRKELFNGSPRIVQIKIGPVPLLSLAGVAGVILSLFLCYSTILPAFTGFPINPLYVVSMLFIMLVGLIIYAISYFYQKSRGVPMELARMELPPT
jgi:hypothetical protein